MIPGTLVTMLEDIEIADPRVVPRSLRSVLVGRRAVSPRAARRKA
jgi:hypothetical protein